MCKMQQKEAARLDRAVDRVTAFRTWEEMRGVMVANGYVPTLRAWTREGAAIGRAAAEEGLRVFWIGE